MKFLLAFLVLVPAIAHAEPLPVWTLEQHYMPTGGQKTMFVLYDDGRVIWSTKKRWKEGAGYMTTLLDAPARDKLLAELPNAAAFAKISEFTDSAPNMVDGVTNVFCRFSPNKRCVLVHGDPTAGTAPELAKVFDRFFGYTSLDAKLWVPETIEVHLYDGKPHGKPHPWPKKWDAPVVPHDNEWMTTIPGADLRELERIADEHRQVTIGIQRRDVSYIVRLPGEDRWRR